MDINKNLLPFEWLHALNDISKKIISDVSEKDLFKTICDEITKIIPFDAFYIDILSKEDNMLRVAYSVDRIEGALIETTKYNSLSPITDNARKILAGKNIIILRNPDDPIPQTARFGDEKKISASLMFVPLKKKNEIIGILSVQSYAFHAYTASHLTLLSLIANQSALAIENVRLTEEAYHRIEDLSLRNKVISEFQKSTNLDSFLISTLNEANKYFSCKGCSVFIKKNGGLSHKMSCFANNINEKFFELTNGSSLPEKVVADMRTVFNNSIDKHKILGVEPIIDTFDVICFLGIPINIHNKILGVFSIYSTSVKIFSPADIDLLMKICSFIAMAIETFRFADRIAESEIKFQTLVENANDVIFTLDSKLKITYLSPQWSNIFGHKIKECLGKTLKTFMPENDYIELEQTIIAAMKEGNRFSKAQIRFIDSRGNYLWQSLNGNALKDVRGKSIGIIGISRDFTELKKSIEQFIQTQKLETIGHITGGIAHDFNNILSSVLGYASLIKNITNEENEIIPYIDKIIKNTEKASYLNDQLIGYSKKGKYSVELVKLNKVILDTISFLKSSLDYRIKINLDLCESLYDVEASPQQMKQVIANLCLNAGESMPDGGNINIKTNNYFISQSDLPIYEKFPHIKEGDFIKIEICDTGVGMSDEAMRNLFELFFSTKGTGRGLGLPAVYGIIENHKGAIFVNSKSKKGTSVSLYLPAIIRHGKKKPSTLRNSPDNGQTNTRENIILVVDDEGDIRVLLSDMLKQINCKALLASGGDEAIEIFKSNYHEIDAVILDILMPGKNGFETFLALEQINKDVKILFASGYDESIMTQSILKRGNVPFLHKPFTIVKLKSELEKLMFRK